MDLQSWLQAHPFLGGVAAFQARVDAAVAGEVTPAPVPALEPLAAEHAAGVPLLRSERVALDLSGAAALLSRAAATLAASQLPAGLAVQATAASAALASPDRARAALAWVATGKGDAPEQAGLVRYLGWSVLRRALAPAQAAHAAWRADKAWDRPYCPCCGALPVQGLLVEHEAGRARRLVCGQCGDAWAWARVGCPHCGNDDQRTLDLLELEGADEGLRLDTCRACKGYVKIVTRAPAEPFLLADWTTLHLDALARERGLERKGASLYEL